MMRHVCGQQAGCHGVLLVCAWQRQCCALTLQPVHNQNLHTTCQGFMTNVCSQPKFVTTPDLYLHLYLFIFAVVMYFMICLCFSFALSAPGWACAWDKDEPVYLYCGLQSGSVEGFDVRMPSQRLHSLPAWHEPANSCPVTSLAAINRDFNSRLKCVCLCVCVRMCRIEN